MTSNLFILTAAHLHFEKKIYGQGQDFYSDNL